MEIKWSKRECVMWHEENERMDEEIKYEKMSCEWVDWDKRKNVMLKNDVSFSFLEFVFERSIWVFFSLALELMCVI